MGILREEILEFPYVGVITRTIEGHGDDDDTTLVVYEGVMDETLSSEDEGRTLRTVTHVISIPLVKNANGEYAIPIRGDEITLTRFGQVVMFTVIDAEPSQLNGVTVRATRKNW